GAIPRRALGQLARRRLHGPGGRASPAERPHARVRADRGEAQARRAARRGDDQPVVTACAPQLLCGSDARAAAVPGNARAARPSGTVRGDGDSLLERAGGAADRAGRSRDRRERAPPQRAPVRSARLRTRRTYVGVTRAHTFGTNVLQTCTTFRPTLSVGGSGGGPSVGRGPPQRAG